MCVCVRACVRACVYALRIVSMDTILHFINTFIYYYSDRRLTTLNESDETRGHHYKLNKDRI